MVKETLEQDVFDAARLGTSNHLTLTRSIEAEQGISIYTNPETMEQLFEGFGVDGDRLSYHIPDVSIHNKDDGRKQEEDVINVLSQKTGMEKRQVTNEVMQMAAEHFQSSFNPNVDSHKESQDKSIAHAIQKFWDDFVVTFNEVRSDDPEINQAIQKYLKAGRVVNVLPEQPASPILLQDA